MSTGPYDIMTAPPAGADVTEAAALTEEPARVLPAAGEGDKQ